MKLFTLFIWLFSSTISANPLSDMTLVGQGEMRWMLWKVYDIQLYSQDGAYRQDTRPVVLSITYARDIAAAQLVQTTLTEWSRIGVNYRSEWKHRLEQIWPSVKRSDKLAFSVGSNGQSRFYFNQKFIGEIEDSDFAEAFLAIWLSPKTSAPELRKALIEKTDV